MSETLAAIVLAAGKGTRMRSRLAKVRHTLLDWPMVAFPVTAAIDAGADRVVVVVGHQAAGVRADLEAALASRPDLAQGAGLAYAEQTEQRGTGHAVQCALEATAGMGAVLILYGDTPALDGATLRAMRDAHEAGEHALTMMTFRAEDPTGYGRAVRDGDGALARVVEHRDATPEERAIDEVNAGMYLVERALLAEALSELTTDNAQGELYLTDIVAHAHRTGRRSRAFLLEDATVVAGVNDRAQLAELEVEVRQRRNVALMREGVTMRSPETIAVGMGCRVGQDAELCAGVELHGQTTVGVGAKVGTGSVLTDCTVAEDAVVKPYTVAEDAVVGPRGTVGPFTHLRPGTRLGADTKVGNFVETKKAVLGDGSKASHLTYLGDCDIGRDVNVGAGTITCNYDGFDKHKTVLHDGVFVGSDTQLVAPVTVGKNVTIAAGTTVTKDVPEGALVLSRVRQVVKEGYYAWRRKPREEAKAAAKAAKGAGETAGGSATKSEG